LTTGTEGGRIADRGNRCGRGEQADTWNPDQLFALLGNPPTK